MRREASDMTPMYDFVNTRSISVPFEMVRVTVASVFLPDMRMQFAREVFEEVSSQGGVPFRIRVLANLLSGLGAHEMKTFMEYGKASFDNRNNCR